MSTLAVILVLISACIHAGWNLLSKSRHPSTAFFLVTTVTGTVLLLPAVVFGHSVVLEAPAQVWWLLAWTSLAMAIYYVALAGAYRSGDMSIAYPLARSTPVVAVLLITLLLGRIDQLSGTCINGILLVVVGCFLIPLERFGDLHPRRYLNATCGLALLAAAGTTGYSMFDDEALRILRQTPTISLHNVPITLAYAGLEGIAVSAWLALFVLIRPAGRASLRHVLDHSRPQAIFTGVAISVGYAIVLVSLAFVNNVSYVVGFRQAGIPLGALLGMAVLKEPAHKPKLAGVAIMFIGLVMLTIG